MALWSLSSKELPVQPKRVEMNFEVRKRILTFSKPAKTSRDILQQREIYYLLLKENESEIIGVGECAPIFGLSVEKKESLEALLIQSVEGKSPDDISQEVLTSYPSLRFAIETAVRDFNNGGTRIIFPESPLERIPINGLVWMNEKEKMLEEALQKIESGFRCVKLKIGGVRFEDELDVLKEIRANYSPAEVEIRLDANGAFKPEDALDKLDALSDFAIHSIEQPIKPGQWKKMAELVKTSPIAIALDEELIPLGIKKNSLLDTILPQYIILKPTLHGGISGCDEWIKLAEEREIAWWSTSALESNIGLNAIAQWVSTYKNPLPQGLGTGKLYVDNIPSPLQSGSGYFWWDETLSWQLNTIFQ